MKQLGIWGSVILILYVLQSSLFPYASMRGVGPDLLLIFTVSFAFLRGSRMGVFLGFFVGLLQDLASGTFFGIDIFSKMIIGYAAGSFSDRVFKEQIVLPLTCTLGATLAQYAIILALVTLLGYRADLILHIKIALIPMLLYNTLFALPIHRLVRAMCERFLPERRDSAGV